MYSKPTRVDATSDDQMMMMISIVFFKKQTESAPYTLRKVQIWEIPGKRLIMKTSTLF